MGPSVTTGTDLHTRTVAKATSRNHKQPVAPDKRESSKKEKQYEFPSPHSNHQGWFI